MRDVVEIEIAASREEVAELFSNPRNSPKWMVDLERYEPIEGEQGMPGSKYRLVSKDMTFVATVVARNLPDSVNLILESDMAVVPIDARFEPAPSGGTRLISTEVFRFKGLLGKIMGLLARRAIRSAHRQQMEAFKRFVEAPPATASATRT